MSSASLSCSGGIELAKGCCVSGLGWLGVLLLKVRICICIRCASVHICIYIHDSTLQHTATHCNTLQHTATHCNTLQHIATHCNTLRHDGHHVTLGSSKPGSRTIMLQNSSKNFWYYAPPFTFLHFYICKNHIFTF